MTLTETTLTEIKPVARPLTFQRTFSLDSFSISFALKSASEQLPILVMSEPSLGAFRLIIPQNVTLHQLASQQSASGSLDPQPPCLKPLISQRT